MTSGGGKLDLATCSWPMARAGDAMRELAARTRIRHRTVELPDAPVLLLSHDRDAAIAWIRTSAACLEIEAEPAVVTYGDVAALLRSGPALVQIRLGDEFRVLAIANSSCITPTREVVRVRARDLRSALAEALEKEVGEPLVQILDGAGVRGKARERVLRAMLAERLGAIPLVEVWHLSVPASVGLWRQLRQVGIVKQLSIFAGANALEYALWILAWILAGRWAMAGRFDMGWLLAWGLVLLTIAPIHTLALWNQSKLAISSSWVMMRTLLEGSFRLDPQHVRGQGAGQLLGRVLDTEALHSLALTGGLTGLIALLQLFAAAALLLLGAQAPWIAALLSAWIAATLLLGWVYYRRRCDWTAARVNLTADTSERMVGHRTRIAQLPMERWHRGEDDSLAGYVERSRNMDQLAAIFVGALPKAWLIVGIAAMAKGIVSGSVTAPYLTAQLGAVLLAHNSLRALGGALASFSGAAISLDRVRDLLAASRKVESPGDPAIAVAMASPSSRPLLAMRDVSYRYPERAASAVSHATVAIAERDRVLMQGASGSGKSTWGSLASGFRVPESGLLFLRGIDRKTIGGREWRRRVASAPQFHENYIFAGSLAFNLLMGGKWPAGPKDLAEAEEICRELGLGTLIDSMPAGLWQMVGETGWQLSNGEKSRIYLARAILQKADLIVLDETFAALDPETAQVAMDCVVRRAPSLVCIAHA
ncbi:MAG TPA: ABC transporter ATP-binding protein [Bryobacteraceae bacterium]|nr:ABC transporter ATP-binding protein [Bryobacteraceae bacterium]